MNRFIFLFCTVLLIGFDYDNKISESEDDKILWGEKIVEWEDFQGVPPSDRNTTIGAITTTIINVSQPILKDNALKMKVHCYFLKNESWTVVYDDYSLAHERLHFDIAEIHARKIRKAFDSLNKKQVFDITEYERVYEYYQLECRKYNYLYDSKVYFNEQRQKQWSEKIKRELKKLDKYKLTNE